ncbi:GNAT family N-acetyltransferase [Tessaracoccus sp. MC1865]|uniref:GNAT family N-acetyltransferase n=1 Tax=Tessaracoccus sp. MC1865 TaxID=2760310 RepID=UPI0016035FA7|nr:GNAT family N-acetyltransferase [Tessaracoccus sp. MC1865]MBB1483772.1 GNAT family N-acetyltransferase [Tessaracoccus sp. MC1865]QTO36841.1 GNAT family N-acetyltransferase [Tessaracoccus sp. MC1865]
MRIRTWSELGKDEFFDIAVLRSVVFYVEQRADVQDFDAHDRAPQTLHYAIHDDGGAAAYLRTLRLATPEHGASWALGRVAVRSDRRGEGLARVLLREAVDRRGAEPIVLHSQTYVQALYAGFGFEPVGEPFDEAGIAHITMVRPSPWGHQGQI